MGVQGSGSPLVKCQRSACLRLTLALPFLGASAIYSSFCASASPTCDMGTWMVPAPRGCRAMPAHQGLIVTYHVTGAVLSPGRVSQAPVLSKHHRSTCEANRLLVSL